MASKLNYSAALEAARMTAIGTTVGSGAKIWLYGGTQPAGPGTTHSQTLLAQLSISGAFAASVTTALPSVLTPNAVTNANAAATGTPTWYRVTTSAGADGGAGLIDGSAATSGADLTIGGTTSGQPVAITSWIINSSNFGH